MSEVLKALLPWEQARVEAEAASGWQWRNLGDGLACDLRDWNVLLTKVGNQYAAAAWNAGDDSLELPRRMVAGLTVGNVAHAIREVLDV